VSATGKSATEPEPKRVLWIIPNFRTSPSLEPYKPLTAGEKFRIATLVSFDRGTVALGLLFAAEAQLTARNTRAEFLLPNAMQFASAYSQSIRLAKRPTGCC
jgi:hypothetical protein